MKKNIEKSVALSYSFGTKVPIIVATGKGELAKKIRAIAEKHNITVIKNDSLAEILINEDVGAYIPTEAYLAVASIFAFLLKNKKQGS